MPPKTASRTRIKVSEKTAAEVSEVLDAAAQALAEEEIELILTAYATAWAVSGPSGCNSVLRVRATVALLDRAVTELEDDPDSTPQLVASLNQASNKLRAADQARVLC